MARSFKEGTFIPVTFYIQPADISMTSVSGGVCKIKISESGVPDVDSDSAIPSLSVPAGTSTVAEFLAQIVNDYKNANNIT